MMIDTKRCQNEGLYLLLENGDIVDISNETVKPLADEFWNDPEKRPPGIRGSEEFKTCYVCPFQGQDVLCSGVKPILPFLEELDKFSSFEKVTAVYRDKAGRITLSETDFQHALEYVAHMAIFEYCEDLKKYQKFYEGIFPYLSGEETVRQLFLNIYAYHRGDIKKVKAEIDSFMEDMTTTTRQQLQRVSKLCDNDAFVNAYVVMQTKISLLKLSEDDILEKM